MKIFIFGANGMLGTYLHKYFEGSVPVTRKEVDALIIQYECFHSQLTNLAIKKGDVIINATGIINKRNESPLDFITVNALFPRLLADYCEKRGIKLIHVSTDCVFDGNKGDYTEDDLSDDTSVYGMSKAAGEPLNCTVIRASIIGENKNNSKDLLEWVRTHHNTTIEGWTNHLWNGITCLQLAKICEWVMANNYLWRGTRHFFSPSPISKADLVEMISDIYELNNKIKKIEGPSDCDRTLDSIYASEIFIPDLKTQIIEQKNFEL
jgi:dTDP-4-dehydrorhamnose reductase